MSSKPFAAWTKPAIQVAAAGLGAAIAGPLGGALGGWLGNALGGPAADLITKYAKEFGEKSAEKLLDSGADSLLEKLKGPSPQLETVYRQSLRISLEEIPKTVKVGFEDWFANWNSCLAASVPLNLNPIHSGQLVPDNLDALLRQTFERLDAQGAAIHEKSNSLILKCRTIPESLLSELNTRLPKLLDENFRVLIVKIEYAEAWNQAALIFRDYATATLGRIDEATQKIDRRTEVLPKVADDAAAARQGVEKLLEIAGAVFNANVEQGRATKQQLEEKEAEIARLAEDLRKLQEQLAARASEPTEVDLSKLLATGDIDGALRLKTKQADTRRTEAGKLPRDLFELGTLHELRFDWPQALVAYREAWQLDHNSEYGFKYAYAAQRQNQFAEAISVYEALRSIHQDPADAASALNNLANLYRVTQRMTEAEEAYGEALSTYRQLAKADPQAYLTDVAMTLNNFGILYSDTQRTTRAEEAYGEALSIRRQLARANPQAYLPDVATTLNNLALLYSATQRITGAEEAYGEALSTYRQLAKANPQAYLPYVAAALNNLALLYSETQRITEAEKAYGEVLSTYRQLAKANPQAYLPDVARSLNNLAILHRATQRITEAEEAYGEALFTYRQLARANPQAYLPYVAGTLNNLANLYGHTQRTTEAEKAYGEALSIRRQLAAANPQAYLPDVAMTLNNLAILHRDEQRKTEAEEAYGEALSTFRLLAEANPQAYLPYVATTLNNLALLFSDTQRLTEAEEAYGEALSIRRQLAEANPQAYLPDVAMTLNNLAILHRDTQRFTEAEQANTEAWELLEPLWQVNLELHGDLMAKILWMGAVLCEPLGESRTTACDLAHRAFATAYTPDLKRAFVQLIDQLCADPQA